MADELKCTMTLWAWHPGPYGSMPLPEAQCNEPATHWWNLDPLQPTYRTPLCTKHALEGNKDVELIID